MAVNKVVMNTENGEKVLMDLTADTVTPDTLAEGATAHDASGNQITGRMTAGGGSGLSVQADWNQNDETAPDFIKNRPFGEKTGYSETLTVEMTQEEIEGLIASGQLIGEWLYKVSDSVVRMSDLGNGFVLDVGREIFDVSADEANEATIEILDGVLSLADMFLIVDENAVGVDLEGLVFPEKGVYINVYVLFEYPYISLTIPGFTFETTVVTKIEEKFIPANIARVSSIVQPDWAQTDETAKDYIKNKPDNDVIVLSAASRNDRWWLEENNEVITKDRLREIVWSGRPVVIQEYGTTHYHYPIDISYMRTVENYYCGYAAFYQINQIRGTGVAVYTHIVAFTAEYLAES